MVSASNCSGGFYGVCTVEKNNMGWPVVPGLHYDRREDKAWTVLSQQRFRNDPRRLY